MKFDAFISYSHSDCKEIAPTIQKALENIGKPWYKQKRNLTIFRDETNLAATPNLWNTIKEALDNSENFIFLASPKAANSLWVIKEIKAWIEKKHSEENGLTEFYIIVTDGNLQWDDEDIDADWEKTDCLPVILSKKFKGKPYLIDLSAYTNKSESTINYKAPGFTSELIKVVAGISNKDPRNVESDELSRKRKTTTALVASILIFAFVIFISGFLYYSNKINQRNSIANNLIAEGNKYGETNINKTLLLYGYAFSISKDTSVYNIVKDFFDAHSIFPNDTANLFYTTKILAQKQDDLSLLFVLDSLHLLNHKLPGTKECKYDENLFPNDIDENVASLKKLRDYLDIDYCTTACKYNYILQGSDLYVFAGLLNAKSSDLGLQTLQEIPLYRIRLLYNEKPGNYDPNQVSAMPNLEYIEQLRAQMLTGLYYNESNQKLYILAQKEDSAINNNQYIYHYELYTFSLMDFEPLTTNPLKIIPQILRMNGFNDLSSEEKKNLRITD